MAAVHATGNPERLIDPLRGVGIPSNTPWPSLAWRWGPGGGLLCDPAHDLAGHQPVDYRQMGCPYDPPTQEALSPVCGEER